MLPFLTVLASPIFGQLQDADEETRSKCAKYERTPLPAEADSLPPPTHWPDCKSYKLYAGIGTPVDYDAARKCAWSERLASQAGLEPKYAFGRVFGGSSILTAIYANGDGVPQNIPLAIRFACETGWAPGEVNGHVEHIAALPGQPMSSDFTFRFCDDFTSDFMNGFCAAYDKQLADQSRAEAWHSLSEQWPEPEIAAFSELVKAELAYSEAHARTELDVSGTARKVEEIEAEQSLRNGFAHSVEAFERGNFPADAEASQASPDASLDRLYNDLLALAASQEENNGAIHPEGVRATQRAWLRYRDAWLAFAALRYPKVSQNSWLALLTADRIAVLKNTLCDMGSNNYPCAALDAGQSDDRSPLLSP